MVGHISRGGTACAKVLWQEGLACLPLAYRRPHVAGVQRPKGLVEAGGVARPPRTWESIEME